MPVISLIGAWVRFSRNTRERMPNFAWWSEDFSRAKLKLGLEEEGKNPWLTKEGREFQYVCVSVCGGGGQYVYKNGK